MNKSNSRMFEVSDETSVDTIKGYISEMNSIITDKQKIQDNNVLFEKFVKDLGFENKDQFLIKHGLVENPNKHKRRVITPKETVLEIQKDLSEKKLTPDEIGKRWNVSRDVVYSIKSKTKKKKTTKNKPFPQKTGDTPTVNSTETNPLSS